MKKNIQALLVVVSIVISGCSKDNETVDPPTLGYSYFPVESGKVTYYQIDSIGWLGYTYDPITNSIQIDTVSYQIKEVVDGFFTDNEGRETARIIRYKRTNVNDPWSLYKVYSSNITPTKAERYEDNIRYTKLIFPIVENAKWIGQYINVPLNDTLIESWEYEYESVDGPGVAGLIAYDSVATVIMKNEINLIEYRYYSEQYAAGFGLIYKEYNDLEYLNTTSSFIKNGFIYKETRIEL